MIKLEVGQKVKFRNGQTGKVTRYRKIYPNDFIPYEVECDAMDHSVHLNEQGIKHPEIDGYESGYDVVEILKEEEEMTIKLEVGQKVKLRNGLKAEVIALAEPIGRDYDMRYTHYLTYQTDDVSELDVKSQTSLGMYAHLHAENGRFWADDVGDKRDVVEILEEAKKEEEEPMEIKARYFKHDGLMYIQNVKESSIIITKVWKEEIVSVMDYGTPIKAKEQMYTYAKLFEVAEVKSH